MDTADFLREMIRIPSLSGRENGRADFVSDYLKGKGLPVRRVGNNLLVRINCTREDAPVVMFNSHLDTVAPSSGYTFDPYDPPFDKDVIWGLGSNDAGGSVASMIAAALHFFHKGGLGFNLLLVLSAEEETSGAGGITLVLKETGCVDCAVIGEPTRMKAAVAERGLLVLDGLACGVSGHAARGEGVNAIYKAIRDIEVLRSHKFEKVSPLMGEVKLTVTQVNAGTQHNVVPDTCRFVVDIRPTDVYSNEEIWNELQGVTESTLTPRSLTHRSSTTPAGHSLMKAVEAAGMDTYVSPTTSDWVRVGGIPAVKIGPGDSARSHTADEYITARELREGIEGYIRLIENLTIR